MPMQVMEPRHQDSANRGNPHRRSTDATLTIVQALGLGALGYALLFAALVRVLLVCGALDL